MKQNTKEQVLRALSEAEGFLSGQELSNLLGVSRTAVWKAIGKLKEEGYEIEAVTNKGYRLAHDQETDILNRTEIEKRLTSDGWKGKTGTYLDFSGGRECLHEHPPSSPHSGLGGSDDDADHGTCCL
mgnify:CR=1 FL=1